MFLNSTVNVLNCLIYFVTYYVFGYENIIMEYFLSNCSYSFEGKSSIFLHSSQRIPLYLTPNEVSFVLFLPQRNIAYWNHSTAAY